MSCIFCQSEKELTGEHVFPAALGGRVELKDGTCKTCNNNFNKAFEEQTTRSLTPIRNLLFIPDRNGEIPKIEAQVLVEGRIHAAKILQGGELAIPPMKFELKASDGGKEIIYRAFSEEDERTLLSNLESKGIKVEPAPSGRAEIAGEFEWKAGFLVSQSALRTIAKVALLGFGHQYGTKPLESNAFDPIKDFIVDGSGDSPVRLFSNEEFLGKTYAGPHQHMVLIAANRKERAIWVIVVLFGGLTFLVNLSQSWEGPDLMKTYGVDAQKGEDCLVLPACLENELNAVSLVLGERTQWNDVKASADAFLAGLRQASAAKHQPPK